MVSNSKKIASLGRPKPETKRNDVSRKQRFQLGEFGTLNFINIALFLIAPFRRKESCPCSQLPFYQEPQEDPKGSTPDLDSNAPMA